MKRTVAILLSGIATLLMLASCGPSWSCVRSGDITDDGSICWKLELHYDKDEFEKPVAQVIGRFVLEDRVSDHYAIHENLLTVCWDSLQIEMQKCDKDGNVRNCQKEKFLKPQTDYSQSHDLGSILLSEASFSFNCKLPRGFRSGKNIKFVIHPCSFINYQGKACINQELILSSDK